MLGTEVLAWVAFSNANKELDASVKVEAWAQPSSAHPEPKVITPNRTLNPKPLLGKQARPQTM